MNAALQPAESGNSLGSPRWVRPKRLYRILQRIAARRVPEISLVQNVGGGEIGNLSLAADFQKVILIHAKE